MHTLAASFASILTLFSGHAAGDQGIQQLNQWQTSGAYIKLASTTAGLRVPSLANLSCLGTDGTGNFGLGTCSGGGGGSSFSTTSANFWASLGLAFSTTSADAWKAQRNFFSTTSADYYTSLGLSFSTTSADAWKAARNFFSTTSATFFSSSGLAFSTTSEDYYKSVNNFFSTSSANFWGTTGSGFSTTSANLWSTFGLGFSTTSALNWGNSRGYIGTSSADTAGQVMMFSTTNSNQPKASGTTTALASCSGTVSCTPFTVFSTTPITLTGSASGSGVGTVATSTADTYQQVPYYDTTNKYPAKLAASTAFTFSTSSANATLTVGKASGTNDVGNIALSYAGGVSDQYITLTAQGGTSGAKAITVPNANGTLAVSASGNIVLSAAGNITLTGTIPYTNGGTGNTSYTTGNLIYAGPTAFQSVATSSETCTSPVTCAAHDVLTGGGAISIPAATNAVNGYLTAADHLKYNTAVATGTPFVSSNAAYFGANGALYNTATTSVTCTGLLSCTGFTAMGAASSLNLAAASANTVLVNQTSGSAVPTFQATSTFGTHLYGDGTGGQVLMWSNVTGAPTWFATSSSGGSTNAAGADTNVQFNDGGTAFGGIAGFNFTKANNQLTIPSNGWYAINSSLFGYASSTNAATIIGLNAGGPDATTSALFGPNTVMGYFAGSGLKSFATGTVAIGAYALQLASSSPFNTAVGYEALQGSGSNVFSLTGQNTAIGYQALASSTTSNLNTAIGYQAGRLLTSGSSNVLIGAGAGQNQVITGSSNTIVGTGSGKSLTSGSSNVYIGITAGTLNDTGSDNTIVGTNAGFSSGSQKAHSFNSIFGSNAGQGITVGGDGNTLFGYKSGNNITSGFDNIFIGETRNTGGNNLTTGGGNIFMGYNTVGTTTSSTRGLNIGNFIFGQLPATSSLNTITEPISGMFSIGSSSPFAKVSIMANAGDTLQTLFAIGSSTASGTSTLFSVGNSGVGSLSIGSSSPTLSAVQGLVTQGPNTANGSSTLSAGKYQIDLYDSAGTHRCAFFNSSGTWTSSTGACNP